MNNIEKSKRIIQSINETEKELEKAEKSLKDSTICLELDKEEDRDYQWIKEDQARVNSLKAHLEKLNKMLKDIA